jgi:DNA-binding response OmpR family regulator
MAPHILIVDDDADIRRLVSDYLGEFNLRVSGAQDAQSMRKELAHEVVDLILLDLKFPEEDGMIIARELRAKSSIPIIMLTSRKEDVDRIMGLELGADDYLTKPSIPANCWRACVPCCGALRRIAWLRSRAERCGPFVFPDGSWTCVHDA